MSTPDVIAQPTNSAFGQIITAADVELAVLQTLRTWLVPDYLAEIARQRGLAPDALPAPRSWVLSAYTEKFPEDQTPALVIASPGISDDPRAYGDGAYTARFAMRVSAHCVARGNRLALRNARWYAGAIRAALVQQQHLLGLLPVQRVDWLGETYDQLPSVDDRTVCIAGVDLAIEVADVLTRHAGPTEPSQTPSPDSPVWPDATAVLVHLNKTPLEGDTNAAPWD